MEYKFNPDYAIAPGQVLKERLEVYGMSSYDLAQRLDCPWHVIIGILNGGPVDEDIAEKLEILGLSAHIWLGIEKDYREHTSV